MEAKIQPQSGLGDLIQALPIIAALAPDIVVATNHRYALAPFCGAIETVPVEKEGALPLTTEGFRHLKYNRYSPMRYRDEYFAFDPNAKDLIDRLYENNVFRVRSLYREFYKHEKPLDPYIVYAPPRAARRHLGKANPFECAPDLYDFGDDLRPVVLVGESDVYPEEPDIHGEVYDMRDRTTFDELCALINNADMVVSQVSAITSLAGLFGKQTKFLKAGVETDEQHERHVHGVIWPGQEEIKRTVSTAAQ